MFSQLRDLLNNKNIGSPHVLTGCGKCDTEETHFQQEDVGQTIMIVRGKIVHDRMSGSGRRWSCGRELCTRGCRGDNGRAGENCA